jgi:hypothetical protein
LTQCSSVTQKYRLVYSLLTKCWCFAIFLLHLRIQSSKCWVTSKYLAYNCAILSSELKCHSNVRVWWHMVECEQNLMITLCLSTSSFCANINCVLGFWASVAG